MPDQLEALVARLRELATLDEDTGRRRLPPERVLGESLGMSRGALREQLAVLERLGFIDRTQGRGTYLATPSYDFVRTYFRISRDLGYLTDAEFSESRLLLEEALSEAAARRATPEQVAQLRADVDRMVASQESGDFDDAREADIAFHWRLQHIVDNPVLRFLHEGLSHVLRDDIAARRQEVAEGTREHDDRTDSVHYEIVDAIAAGDPVGARLAMRRHFGGVALGMRAG
ncbi:FadR/GntR family transcriptional regulator [Microbacterium cremeum]|uniref:FadR/GntR family transcriptional regulator n=1 Tax=Microbacterium cremeum TaxID=2782169 RepID=UPI001E2BB720|nr:FCD domain-containing protein [Microbacterium cremeum]